MRALEVSRPCGRGSAASLWILATTSRHSALGRSGDILGSVNKADAQRLLAGYAAVDEANRRARLAGGADPGRAIRVALSMIDAASGRPNSAEERALQSESEQAVRETWNRLRKVLLGGRAHV